MEQIDADDSKVLALPLFCSLSVSCIVRSIAVYPFCENSLFMAWYDRASVFLNICVNLRNSGDKINKNICVVQRGFTPGLFLFLGRFWLTFRTFASVPETGGFGLILDFLQRTRHTPTCYATTGCSGVSAKRNNAGYSKKNSRARKFPCPKRH